ncbi:hypothetical protein IKD67_03825 [Candidatus Saccharibacteria bacterium]|nr:hypothetical protein [Candidatus Saccharibacteria bacterium]
MNVAEWIIVAILSMTLLVFLIMGIVLIAKLIGISKEVEKLTIEGQDIARNANGIAANVKGMTAIGGVVEGFVDNYVMPKIKEKTKEKETKNGNKKAK